PCTVLEQTDGRTNVLPAVQTNTVGDGWRPLHYRGRINVNTASFPVLEALYAKLLRANEAAGAAAAQTRARNLALSMLRYREWYYYTPTLPGVPAPLPGVTSGSLWDTRQGSLYGWTNVPGNILTWTGIFSVMNNQVPCAPSILTQYMQSKMSTFLGNQYDPFGVGTDCRGAIANVNVNNVGAQSKLNWPNDKNNPPYRNITQLLDVRWAPFTGDPDPRDVITPPFAVSGTRMLALNCAVATCFTIPTIRCIVTGNPVTNPPGALGCAGPNNQQPLPIATASARVFPRVDQDIAVMSYGSRIESLGKVGDAATPRFTITMFGLPQEIERVQKDDLSLFTKLY
ncbi:MAG: hypothetical protein ACREJQ_02165, partial [bacterium]